MNLVASAEDVLSHLGVPEAGLVAEVATGFEHFTHADGHFLFSKVMSNTEALAKPLNCGHPESLRRAIY